MKINTPLLNKIYGCIFAIVFVISCKGKVEGQAVITGNVKNLPDGKIYLVNTYRWEQLLDSTVSKNGQFKLVVGLHKGIEPYPASLLFFNKEGKLEKLYYDTKNINAPNGKPFLTEAFMLEEGETVINGVYEGFSPPPNLKISKLNIDFGKQTEAEYRMTFLDFSSSNYFVLIKDLKNLIVKYPYSFFLIQKLYENRSSYRDNDFNDMLVLFNKDIQASKTGTQIKEYLSIRATKDDKIFNQSLYLHNKGLHNVINQKVKINMLIFWASWCGPCRVEIPKLKEIYSKFKGNKNLQMVSISIDQDKVKWLDALNYEKMPWNQYWVNSDEHQKVMDLFGVSDIPVTLFIDHNGKEIQRFVGYSENQEKRYLDLLKHYMTVE